MTKIQTALSAATLLLAMAVSTLPAPAQTTLDAPAACQVANADAHSLTNDTPERPWVSYETEFHPSGTAIVQIDLNADGTLQNATIVKSTGDPTLDRAAKKFVATQRFAPEVRDCQAIGGTYLYQVDYPN
jgi:protein TonB